MALCPGDHIQTFWLDDHLFVAHRIRFLTDAQYIFKKILTDCAEHWMTLRTMSCPIFRYGSSAHLHTGTKGIFLLRSKKVCRQFTFSSFKQNPGKNIRSKNTGIIFFDFFIMVYNIGKGSLIPQPKVCCKHVTSLLVFCEISGFLIKISVTDGLLFPLYFLLQVFIHFMFSQNLSNFQNFFHGFNIEIGIYKRSRNVNSIHIIYKSHSWNTPVTKAPLPGSV